MPTNDDLYDFADIKVGNTTDNVQDQNQFPEPVEESLDRPSNPDGRVSAERVDYYQDHKYYEFFNQPTGQFSLYDPDNQDRQLFDLMEEELITISSPPIRYYKLIANWNQIDPLYGESLRRDGYANPVTIFGSYEDPTIDQQLVNQGIEQIETIEVYFNYNHLLRSIGDRVQIGDILMLFDGKLYEIMTSTLIDESLWRAQHIFVTAKRLQTEGIFLPDMDDIVRSPNIPTVC